MQHLSLLVCLALLLAAVPALGAATHSGGNCRKRVRNCVACRLTDPKKCRDCKPGMYPVTYYPNIQRCVDCPNFCADCTWSETAPDNVKCIKPCDDPQCRVCTPDGATCKDCIKGLTVVKGKCEQLLGGVGFCGASNPMGDLYYLRSEQPYANWEFRNLPKGCWPCEEPAYTNCKDCGFCTPGTAGCTASNNYDGAGRWVGLSRVDGFKCLTCKNGSPATKGRCT